MLDSHNREKRCDLLLALGEAMLPSEEPRRAATEATPEAFALAESLGDSSRAAHAAVIALEALVRSYGGAGPRVWRLPETQEWLARADRSAAAETAARVYADVRLAMSHMVAGAGPRAAHPILRRAVERAREMDDQPAFFLAAAYGLRFLLALRDRETANQLADEVLRRPRHGARSGDLGLCLRFAGSVLLERGDRAGAEAIWRELAELAERTRDATLAVVAMSPSVELAMLDGRLDDVLAAVEAAAARADELGVGEDPNRFQWARALIHLGRADESIPRLGDPGRPAQLARAMCLAHLGRHDEGPGHP